MRERMGKRKGHTEVRRQYIHTRLPTYVDDLARVLTPQSLVRALPVRVYRPARDRARGLHREIQPDPLLPPFSVASIPRTGPALRQQPPALGLKGDGRVDGDAAGRPQGVRGGEGSVSAELFCCLGGG